MQIIPSGYLEQLGFIIVVSALFALLSRAFKLPLLVGYIAAGIGIGGFLGITQDTSEIISGAAKIGLTLLLFLVGLELNWDLVKKQFKNAFGLGVVQIILSLGLGFGISHFFGFNLMTGLYLGISLSFASTVVVVKLLSEAHDTNALHGRLSVSILLIQDLFAIIALILLSGIADTSTNLPLGLQLIWLSLKTIGVLILAWSCNRLILPAIFKYIAHSTELLFLCSIAWCFLWVIGMQALNIPMEIGALIAGVSLATLPYSTEIVHKVKILRDFFVVLLFVGIGSEVHAPSSTALPVIITIVAAVVVGRPIFAYFSLAFVGYRKRTAFLTALTQSQLSEFSIILIGVGVTAGIIDREMNSIIATSTALSIGLSAILFGARKPLYSLCKPILHYFERGHRKHRASLVLGDYGDLEKLEGHIVIFGYHRMGYHILQSLLDRNMKVIVIDMNPEIITKLRKEGITAIYGDAEDEEIFDIAQITTAQTVISTIPHVEENQLLISEVKKRTKKASIIVTAHSIEDALRHYKNNADFVLLPHMLGGRLVGEFITQNDTTELKKQRVKELTILTSKDSGLLID